MRKNIYRIVCMLGMMLLLGACSTNENILDTQQGNVEVTVNVDATFTSAAGATFQLDPSLVPASDSLAFTLTQADGATHTWPGVAQFRHSESTYSAGQYTAAVSGSAGPDAPVFEASQAFEMKGGEVVTVALTARPANAMLSLQQTVDNSDYTLESILVREPLAGFHEARDTMFLNPGNVEFFATLSDGTRTATLALGYELLVSAAHSYDAEIQLKGRMLELIVNGAVVVSHDLSAGLPEQQPQITVSGFTPGVPVEVNEGVTLSQPLKMTVTSPGAPLAHVMLNVVSPLLKSLQLPYADIDLLNLTDEQRETLRQSGFVYTLSDDGRILTADFTAVVEEMASWTSETTHITMMAQDTMGACSEPVTLTVITNVVELELVEASAAVVGVNSASVTLNSNIALSEDVDFKVFAKATDGTYSIPCPVMSLSTVYSNNINLSFTVPSGLEDVDIAVSYLGLQRFTTVIRRVNPTVEMDIDAFATTAIIRVNIPQATPEGFPEVVNMLRPYVDGAPASVWRRAPEQGFVIINGLEPDKDYNLEMRLVGDVPVMSKKLRTERASAFPGDIQEYRTIIDYKHLASGGRYSATPLSIVNRQNFTDVEVLWPKKKWASKNDCTFNTASTNRNTWYMQPSAWLEPGMTTGTRALCLTSVGYNHNGPEIPDFIQPADAEITNYSRNVPPAGHTTAGEAWLGSYSYNATTGVATAVYGEPFTSRPSSLNGFYKYLTDLTDGDDYGTVDIQLVRIDATGNEQEVAAGHLEFRTSPDYKAFNVPLSYALFNVHPTHLRVRFSSSHRADDQVPVTADLRQAAFLGSRLWLTALSFSY